jgi:hypothetical protein
MIKIEVGDTPIEVAEKLVNASICIEKSQIQKAIGKAFGNEDDYYHTQMFTENELEEIADHLYAVVKRVRKEQEDDEKFLDDQIKECERQEEKE